MKLQSAFLAITAVIALPAVPLSAASLWSDGHGDIGVAFDGSEFDLHWHIAGGTVDGTVRPDDEFAPSELSAELSDSALAVRQSNSPGRNWDPIGVGAGESFWRIGSVATAGVPFLGFAVEEGFDSSEWIGGVVFTLTALSAPSGGHFSAYHFDLNTGDLVFDMASYDGISPADAFEIPVGTHSHLNLTFSAPGRYDLTLSASGMHETLGALTAEETFTFLVIPEPSSLLLLAGGLSVLALRSRRR